MWLPATSLRGKIQKNLDLLKSKMLKVLQGKLAAAVS